METLAVQPSVEQLRSFDPIASVDMMRFDLEHFGHVLPETRKRVYDEELSSIAEGVERASRTEFVLARKGDDLVYFDRGEWRSYTGMLITGKRTADAEAQHDLRRQFLARWANRDLEIGYRLRSLRPGDVQSWTNSYPHEIENEYGAAFMSECGLFPARKMGFLYRAECLDDGSVVLESQTLDQSDKDGFLAISEAIASDQKAGIASLTAAYDATVTEKTGTRVYAGRSEATLYENGWQEIIAHRDLVEYLLDGLERIATKDMSRGSLETMTIEHIVGVWKAFKMRLGTNKISSSVSSPWHEAVVSGIQEEVRRAYSLARSQGDIKVGCGGALMANQPSGKDDSMSSTFDAIFGDKQGSEQKNWKWKQGICRVEACPTRPGKTKVGPCEVCVRCQAKFDGGQDPTKDQHSSSIEAATAKDDPYEMFIKSLKKAVEDKKLKRSEFGLVA